MGRLPRAPPAWTSVSWSLAPRAETPGLTRQEQTRSPAHIRPAGHCRHSLVAGPGCACDRFESLDLVESPCQTNTVPGSLPPVPEPPLVPGCSLREARGRGDVLPGPKLCFHVQVRHQEGPPPPHPRPRHFRLALDTLTTLLFLENWGKAKSCFSLGRNKYDT